MAITTWAATTGDWDDSKFSRAWDGPNIAPAVGSLSLSATAASLTLVHNISPEKGDIEVIQSYEWNQLTTTWATTLGTWESGPVPSVVVGIVITPDKADLSLSAFAPAQGIIYTFPITKGDFTLTGYAPAFGQSHFMSPANADLTGLGTRGAWNDSSYTWATISGNWLTGELTPTAGITYTFPIDEAETLTLDGYSPIKVKKDPTYLADIMVS